MGLVWGGCMVMVPPYSGAMIMFQWLSSFMIIVLPLVVVERILRLIRWLRVWFWLMKPFCWSCWLFCTS